MKLLRGRRTHVLPSWLRARAIWQRIKDGWYSTFVEVTEDADRRALCNELAERAFVDGVADSDATRAECDLPPIGPRVHQARHLMLANKRMPSSQAWTLAEDGGIDLADGRRVLRNGETGELTSEIMRGVAKGTMSVNEARAALGLDPIANDVYIGGSGFGGPGGYALVPDPDTGDEHMGLKPMPMTPLPPALAIALARADHQRAATHAAKKPEPPLVNLENKRAIDLNEEREK